MTRIVAILPTDLQRGPLGLTSQVGAVFNGTTVLGHTLARLRKCCHLDEIILLHPADQNPQHLLKDSVAGWAPRVIAADHALQDFFHPRRISARKWSLHAWRGGLAGATCFDEILAPAAMASATEKVGAQAVLMVGPDWPFVDPVLCDRIIERHLEAPEALQMTFSQAAPGLAGLVIGAGLLQKLSTQHDCMIGRVLDYSPSHPQPDPIGRDMCVSVDPQIRDTRERFICDTPRSIALLNAILGDLGNGAEDTNASRVVDAAGQHQQALVERFGPRQVTLELTPRRAAGIGGTLVSQAHVALDRSDMELDLALRLIKQIADAPDMALCLGGLGDALEYNGWQHVVQAAHEAGILGIAIDTDLVCEQQVVQELADAPIDILSVRLNADTAAIYAEVMAAETADGRALFAKTTNNLEMFLNTMRRRSAQAETPCNIWLVPRMVKSRQTLPDMESFFDRWVHHAGHAVIEPFMPGRSDRGDLMPGGGMVAMAPPVRAACRQVNHRLTILSNGLVTQCDQDWLATHPLGNARDHSLSEIWSDAQTFRDDHLGGRWNERTLCKECRQWNRP